MIDQTVFNNKKAAYYTLGCKLNFAETSTIGKLLAEQGVRKVRPGEKADICVVNTCPVTELADKKCRQAIRRISTGELLSPHKARIYVPSPLLARPMTVHVIS